MHSNSPLDVFAMDLDAPELMQALEDFTKQILSPENHLSSGLEQAMLSISGQDAQSTQASGIDEDSGSGIVSPLIVVAPNSPPAESTVPTAAFPQPSTPHNEDILPLTEPEFQVLTEFGDSFAFSPILELPSAELKCTNEDKLIFEGKGNFSLMDTYSSYDAWGSPGSVESDILFPELAQNTDF
jgi:hypothetical protein